MSKQTSTMAQDKAEKTQPIKTRSRKMQNKTINTEGTNSRKYNKV